MVLPVYGDQMVISWYTMIYLGVPWYTMLLVYHGIPWYTMVYHAYTMVYHGKQWCKHGKAW